MDSKKVIETLLKIARNQQKIITKLAQQTGGASHDPMESTLPEYKGPRYDVSGKSVDLTPMTPTPQKKNPLLAPIGTKLTEEEWRAMEKQRGMKPGEASETTEPGWVPQTMAPKAPSTPTSPSGPAQQGGPPGQSKPLTETEKQYLEMLRKKNAK